MLSLERNIENTFLDVALKEIWPMGNFPNKEMWYELGSITWNVFE
jgi:hypothetical protein